MKLNARIRYARRRADLTQVEFAHGLGVGRSAVANWECADDTGPSAERLARIATLTGVSFEWLATGRGEALLDHDHSTPAVDALLVVDPVERRLVEAYRSCPAPARRMLFHFIESQMVRPGKKPARP